MRHIIPALLASASVASDVALTRRLLGGLAYTRADDAERIIGEALLLIDRIQLTLKNVQ